MEPGMGWLVARSAMSPRAIVSIILTPLAATVMFGTLFTLVLSSGMAGEAARYAAAAAQASALVAWPLAWECAPYLLSRGERTRR
jgi:hypothetical protein